MWCWGWPHVRQIHSMISFSLPSTVNQFKYPWSNSEGHGCSACLIWAGDPDISTPAFDCQFILLESTLTPGTKSCKQHEGHVGEKIEWSFLPHSVCTGMGPTNLHGLPSSLLLRFKALYSLPCTQLGVNEEMCPEGKISLSHPALCGHHNGIPWWHPHPYRKPSPLSPMGVQRGLSHKGICGS